MSVDLVALRRAAAVAAGTDRARLMLGAADEIEALRAENAAFREAHTPPWSAFMNPPTPKWAPPVADLPRRLP